MDGSPKALINASFVEWAFPRESLSRQKSGLGMVHWEFRGCTGQSHPEVRTLEES